METTALSRHGGGMRDFLSHLLGAARSAAPLLQPRLPSRFAPPDLGGRSGVARPSRNFDSPVQWESGQPSNAQERLHEESIELEVTHQTPRLIAPASGHASALPTRGEPSGSAPPVGVPRVSATESPNETVLPDVTRPASSPRSTRYATVIGAAAPILEPRSAPSTQQEVARNDAHLETRRVVGPDLAPVPVHPSPSAAAFSPSTALTPTPDVSDVSATETRHEVQRAASGARKSLRATAAPAIRPERALVLATSDEPPLVPPGESAAHAAALATMRTQQGAAPPAETSLLARRSDSAPRPRGEGAERTAPHGALATPHAHAPLISTRPAAEPPVVRISIGRIEVRVSQPPVVSERAPAVRPAIGMSLKSYLERREGRTR